MRLRTLRKHIPKQFRMGMQLYLREQDYQKHQDLLKEKSKNGAGYELYSKRWLQYAKNGWKKENDLVEVAQYYCNEKQSRNEINERILNRFVTDSQENESIKILSELPIHTFWTTNYDHLIEDTLKKSGKSVDIKLTPQNLATNLSGNDAVVYKMHGDCSTPENCVIIKDDYELYNETRQLFSTTLQGDLVSKTFLFIGFSFEDPNLKYILSRIRVLLDKNRRTHYLFLKKIQKKDYIRKSKEYYYDLNKQQLRMHDLLRYGIETVLIDDYNQIPEILKEVKKISKCNILLQGELSIIHPISYRIYRNWEDLEDYQLDGIMKTKEVLLQNEI